MGSFSGAGPPPQPSSWGEMCNTYRSNWGSGSFSTVNDKGAAVQQRFARSVPTMCPLSETRHPLFTSGEPLHQPNDQDGSLYRSNRHGWGDVSLLRHDPALASTPHRSAGPPERRGRAAVEPPGGGARDSLGGEGVPMLASLAGAGGGGGDAWIGNEMINPSKGRRAASAPRDPKGRRGLAEVLSLASPGKPDDDAWLGCVGIDPARGRRRVQEPLALRGRRGLYRVLQPDRPPALWEGSAARAAAAAARGSIGGGSGASTLVMGSGGGGGAWHGAPEDAAGTMTSFGAASGTGAAVSQHQQRLGNEDGCQDAWLGNPGIDPRGGKRAASPGSVAAAAEHLWGATFRGGPPADGCWSDIPKIGKRPMPDPAAIKGVVRAAHALRQEEPLPPGMTALALPGSDGHGKRILGDALRPQAVNVYSLLTFKDLHAKRGGGGGALGGSGSGGSDDARWWCAWDDAPSQPRRRAPGKLPGSRPPQEPGLLDWAPNKAARFVPYGGLAQEKGMSLDDISKIAAIARKGGSTMPKVIQSPSPKARAAAAATGGASAKQQPGGRTGAPRAR